MDPYQAPPPGPPPQTGGYPMPQQPYYDNPQYTAQPPYYDRPQMPSQYPPRAPPSKLSTFFVRLSSYIVNTAHGSNHNNLVI